MEDLKGWAVLFFIVALFFICASAGKERREVKKRRKDAYQFEPVSYDNPNSPSSARWACDKLLKAAGLFKGKGWRIGYSQSGKVLRYGGPGHLLIVAGARKGKMISVLAPAALEACKGSRAFIDPKGELCAVTHNYAALFSEVVALDPFGTLKQHGVRGPKLIGLNPLASLDPKSVSFGGDVASLTEAIVWEQESSAADRHWTDSARQLVAAVIRVIVKYGPRKERNLLSVREAICGDIFAFARRWKNCDDSSVRQALMRYAAPNASESKELNGVVSTAVVQTEFLAMEGIAESLTGDGLRFSDLKKKRMTVYIVLPLDKLASCGKWFRLCVATAIADLLKAGPSGLPVLCVIDEFFSIGSLKAFQTAMSQAAGAAGLQLWPVLQDLAQLQTMYPNQGWRTFLSNTAVKIFFGDNGDRDTAEYISAMCGDRQMVVPSRSVSDDRRRDLGGGLYDVNVSDAGSLAWERLVRPHEVSRMGDGEMIVFCEKVGGPILAKRKPYFQDWAFRGRYGKNPYWGGR